EKKMKLAILNVTSSSKKKKVVKSIAIIIGVFLFTWASIFLFPVSERPSKPFFEYEEDRPLVIAHQGGERLAPSNTLVAFENARELGVDALEFDIHMTIDGHLVAVHDSTVNRTTNGLGRVNDMPLEQIRGLDAGYYFEDEEGNYPFRGKGITIPTVEEIFEQFGDMKLVIELKATNDAHLYEPMSDKLWELVQEYDVVDNVLVASFEHTIVEYFQQISNDQVAISGGKDDIKKFVIFHKLFLNSIYRPQIDALQIPTEDSGFDLTDKKLLRGAHNRGMDVHYWTINDKETMQELIDLGADGIITDRPDLMMELLK
ncbi:glycerophosphodiester phosphodiesterase, partial [Evansella sp. AB-rgal1]|uniref:glycerophosphodiester phosphodiesterase n=1 Tax=Evansella sp. AB-rgal1 TaxID=3242696 RepID=UPI00359D0812